MFEGVIHSFSFGSWNTLRGTRDRMRPDNGNQRKLHPLNPNAYAYQNAGMASFGLPCPRRGVERSLDTLQTLRLTREDTL